MGVIYVNDPGEAAAILKRIVDTWEKAGQKAVYTPPVTWTDIFQQGRILTVYGNGDGTVLGSAWYGRWHDKRALFMEETFESTFGPHIPAEYKQRLEDFEPPKKGLHIFGREIKIPLVMRP